MSVNSYKYLPRLIAVIYQEMEVETRGSIPWTPIPHPLSECRFGLVTTGGLYQKGVEPPFDLDREKFEPTWGDPTYRTIPADISLDSLGVSHLHVNNDIVSADINILLPVQRLRELTQDGLIAGQAREHYSFMGYQGYPPDTSDWEQVYAPEITEKFIQQDVNCILLTPS